MELFLFKPNWEQGITERLAWLTDVIVSHDDTEERLPLRVRPRRSLEYNLAEVKNGAAKIDALLWGWQSQKYLVPIWTDMQTLTADLALGSSVVPATTEYHDFEDGGLAVFLPPGDDYDNYEIVEIVTVGASSLLIDVATTRIWPAGSLLVPVRYGRLPREMRKHMHTDWVAEMPVRFDLDPSDHTPAPGATLYRDIEVFERSLNWIDGLPNAYTRKIRTLDYAAGPVFVDDNSDLARVTQTYKTLLNGKADIAAWRGWLYARQGRYVPFWASARQWMLEQTASIAAASDALTVKAVDFDDAYGTDPGRQDIALLHRDGTWYYHRVDAVTPSGADEVLTLDSALGIDADPGDFVYITWLMPSRLAGDAVEIAWHTNTLAECTLEIRSAKALEYVFDPPPAVPTVPPEPPEPETPTPEVPEPSYDYAIDMSVANHLDFAIAASGSVVVRFSFSGTAGESYTHFTAVLLATGPCLNLAIDQYGYAGATCAEEKSESVATEDTYTDWVVERNKYIYLEISNEAAASGTVRLSWNGENIYYP